MDVHFNRRAMIAIRSLDPAERMRVDGVVTTLSRLDGGGWRETMQVTRLPDVRGEQFFSVKVDDDLRLLARVVADALVVDDVFYRERLERITGVAVS